MMLLRQPGAANTGVLVDLIKTVTQDVDAATLEAHIRAGTVPGDFIELATRYIEKHPSLISVSDTEFYVAMIAARPDMAGVITTPQGKRWTEATGTKIAVAMPLRWLSSLIGG